MAELLWFTSAGCAALGPGEGEGHATVWRHQKDVGASVWEACQVRSQDSACWGHGVQLGCEAVTAEASGPHVCSRAGVVLQSCGDRPLVAVPPGRGHALGVGGHSCEAPATKDPWQLGKPSRWPSREAG